MKETQKTPRIDKEFKSILPQPPADVYEQLEKNIKKETNPKSIVITTWHDIVIDGHKLYEICRKNKINFTIVKKEFDNRDDVKIWIIESHLGRRNLNTYQRCVLALKAEPLYKKRAKAQQGKKLSQNSEKSKPIDRYKELAKIANVSHDTIAKVKKIEEKATPKQKKALETGEASVNEIFNQIKEQKSDDGSTDSDNQESEQTSDIAPQKPVPQEPPEISEESHPEPTKSADEQFDEESAACKLSKKLKQKVLGYLPEIRTEHLNEIEAEIAKIKENRLKPAIEGLTALPQIKTPAEMDAAADN